MSRIEGLKINKSSYLLRSFKTWLLACVLLIVASNANAQSLHISGVVTGQGEGSLPSVSVVIQGTTIGTITDLDGKYTLSANVGDVLVFGYIGYLDKEVQISNQTEINIELKPDLLGIDEVVVIGYGVQKKKLNTGSTVNIKGEEIQKMNTISAIGALKSNSPGVNITADNGVPGSGSKVIIRGIGTMGNAAPLYVVDGVSVNNIDYLSPSDIASIDILKDAASTAIYGSRAANGVILVSTKTGKMSAKPSITFDSYSGWQQISKRPGRVNAQTYMELMEEAWAYDGQEINWQQKIGDDWEQYRDGTNPGTNWVDEIYNENAPTQSYTLGVTGGNEASTYSLGLGYVNQEGIIGDPSYSTYKRINARLNSEHVIIKGNNRNILKIGQVFTFSNFSKPNVAAGGLYYNDLHMAIVTYPILPMYADENTPEEYGDYHEPLPIDAKIGNPVASARYNRMYRDDDNNNMVGNAYLQLEPIIGLVFKSAYGFNSSFGSIRAYTPAYTLSITDEKLRDKVTQEHSQSYTHTFTNTLAYSFSVKENHNITAMIGSESTKNTRNSKVKIAREGSSYGTWDRAYIDLTPITYDNSMTDLQGYDYQGYGMLSYFGRISYDFKESLLATFVYRADASNNLAPGHQWGGFASASLGYILSDLQFMKNISSIDYLKIRGGWGQNGNDRIGAFQYSSSLASETGNYPFGDDPNVIAIGHYPASIPNENIGWETSVQSNIGLDAHFLNSRLQIVFDLYDKTTKDWLVNVPKPMSNGAGSSIDNGGAVNNRGIELALNWSDNIGDFSYSLGGNFSYNKNEVIELKAEGGYFDGNSNIISQGVSPCNRVEVGKPIGYFYGYETDGILQNEAEVLAYSRPDTLDGSGNPIPYYSDAMPGDFRFVDQNGDGVISDEFDRVMIGDPTPDYTFGFNISAQYKGAYLGIAANGAAGHQIAMNYRPSENDSYTEYHLNRWTGEGSTNIYPRLTKSAIHRNYKNISNYHVLDADYLRISNITLGYDVNSLFKNSPMGEIKLYVSAINAFTFTKYPGMSPEVGFGGNVNWGSGIDLGLYPQSKSYLIGISARF